MSYFRTLMVAGIAGLAVTGYLLFSDEKAPAEASKKVAAGIAPTAAAPAPAPSVTVPTSSLIVIPPPTETIAAPRPPTPLQSTQPAPGMPVQQFEAMLRDPAIPSDPKAACRLGIELIRCGRLVSTRASLEAARIDAERAAKDTQEGQRSIQVYNDLAGRVLEDERVCRGVSRESSRDAWKFLLAAATAGNVAAMSRFVRDPGMDQRDPDSAPAWEEYERVSPEFIERSLENGDVRVLYHAWLSATNDRWLNGKIIPRDLDKSLAYGLALTGLLDQGRGDGVARSNEAVAKEIGKERAEAARQEAAALRNGNFANALPTDFTDDHGAADIADCLK